MNYMIEFLNAERSVKYFTRRKLRVVEEGYRSWKDVENVWNQEKPVFKPFNNSPEIRYIGRGCDRLAKGSLCGPFGRMKDFLREGFLFFEVKKISVGQIFAVCSESLFSKFDCFGTVRIPPWRRGEARLLFSLFIVTFKK